MVVFLFAVSCDSFVCQNGGICITVDQCDCSGTGYTGDLCDIGSTLYLLLLVISVFSTVQLCAAKGV